MGQVLLTTMRTGMCRRGLRTLRRTAGTLRGSTPAQWNQLTESRLLTCQTVL